MTHFQMYLITRLDGILKFAGVMTFVSFITILVATWGYYEMKADFEKKLERANRGDWDVLDAPDIERTLAKIKEGITAVWVLFGSLFLISLATLLGLPSEKDLYKIIAVPKIVNNETIKADCKELYDLAIEALEEKIKPKEERK